MTSMLTGRRAAGGRAELGRRRDVLRAGARPGADRRWLPGQSRAAEGILTAPSMCRVENREWRLQGRTRMKPPVGWGQASLLRVGAEVFFANPASLQARRCDATMPFAPHRAAMLLRFEWGFPNLPAIKD